MYYDGNKLLNLLDVNGNKPEIYICTSNRSAGKTTFFNKYLLDRFLKKGEKFCILYRFKYEIKNSSDKFFKGINNLFFNGYEMTEKSIANGIIVELFLNKKSCGYAISINSADKLKTFSHLLSDVSTIIFDEFQSENNLYCSDEILKFQSIHTSIARGNGKQSKYVPVIMLSNQVTILNPYYTALNIGAKLQKNTKFLRGDGFVLEQGFNESAKKELQNSAFNRAFKNSSYAEYSQNNKYLLDNSGLIQKISGKNKYLATIIYNGKQFSIREYENNIVYCGDSVDNTFPLKICVSVNDMQQNYILYNTYPLFISMLRKYFNVGLIRFKNYECKEAILKLLSY